MESQLQCKFVSPDEFRNLATSRRSLERADDSVRNLRGLIDPVEGVKYLVSANALFALPQTLPGKPARALYGAAAR